MSGIRLDEEAILLGTEEELLELCQSADDIIEDVRRKLKNSYGVHPYARPVTVPEDLGAGKADTIPSMTDDELSILLAQYNSYASFLSDKLAEAKSAYRLADTNQSRVKKLLTLRFRRETDIAKTDVDTYVAVHAVFVHAEDEANKLYAMREILEARYQAYSKQASTLSRLIEIRKEEHERSSSNPGGRKRGLRPGLRRP